MKQIYSAFKKSIFIIIICIINLGAQPWNREVITGGASYISKLTFDNSVVYAATWGSGVYYSRDKGASWKPMNRGLANQYVYTLIAVGKSLLAGTEGGGVYKCNKRKMVWRPSNRGLGGNVVFSLVEKDGVLLAATWQEGLFRSLDGGNSWKRSSEGLGNSVIYTVTAGKNIFYAGASKNGAYISKDEGAVWENIGLAGMSILCIHNLDSVVLFGTWKHGIFRLKKDANEWEKIEGAFGESVKSAAYREGEGSLYCAKRMMGIYKSGDYGETWSNIGLAGQDVFSIVALHDRIITGTWGNGVFTLRDGSTEWINTYKALNGRKTYYSEQKAENVQVGSNNKQPAVDKPSLTGTRQDINGLSKSHITLVKTCYSGRLVVCYKIKNSGKVSLSLYDHRGRVKKEKMQIVQGKKIQETSFCKEALKSGIYFISLRTSIDREVVAVVHLK